MLKECENFLDKFVRVYESTKKKSFVIVYDQEDNKSDTLEIVNLLKSDGYLKDVILLNDRVKFTLTFKAIEQFT